MKKWLWILSLILFFFGYAFVSPFITVYQIRQGVRERDSKKISENIDFPLLRQNLKQQFNHQIGKKTGSLMKNNLLGALAAGLGSKVADQMVDNLVTPSGLARLMAGHLPEEGKGTDDAANRSDLEKDMDMLKKARFAFESMDRFSLWIKDNRGKEVQLVLTRKGLEWRLSNIVVP